MTQDDKSASDLEFVKLIYHTAHKTAEDKGNSHPHRCYRSRPRRQRHGANL